MKQNTTIGLVVVVVLLVIGAIFIGANYFSTSTSDESTQVSTSTGAKVDQCAVAPAYTYSAIDAFASGTTVGGTDYIKLDGNAPVTSLASPTVGKSLQYWKSNATYACGTDETSVACSTNSVQVKCYANASTATLGFADVSGSVTAALDATGANNITIGANSVKNIEMTYSGVSKKSLAPFGGCLVVEYPVGLTVSVKGAGIDSSVPCAYAYSYSASAGNTYKAIAVPEKFDTDAVASPKKISVQISSGSANPAGTFTAKIQSANNYVTDAGDIVKGVEKDKNQDTTLVGNAVLGNFTIV